MYLGGEIIYVDVEFVMVNLSVWGMGVGTSLYERQWASR